MMQAYKQHLAKVAKPQLKTQAKKGKTMEILKELLGEELYNQLMSKINEHNGNEANKDKQIKLENINSGNYVSKLKFDDLQRMLNGKEAELTTANGLIEELKKGTKGNEELQTRITTYEAEIEKLQAENAEIKKKSAIKIALLSEKAADVDYLTYKLEESLKEKGETLELDDNDNIKGWDDKLSGLKTQFPKMFDSVNGGDGFRPLEPNKLPKGDGNKTVTKDQFAKMGYEERLKLKQENEELFRQMAKK